MIATDRDRDSLRFDLPVRRSTRTPSRRSLSVSRHCSLHRRTATATANSPPLDYKDSSHIATQSELRASAAEFPFGLRSPAAARLSWSSLIFLWGGAAAVVVVCRALCAHLPRPLSPVLRLSSPPPPPFFFAVRGSGGGVCRRRPAARNRRQGRVGVSTGR